MAMSDSTALDPSALLSILVAQCVPRPVDFRQIAGLVVRGEFAEIIEPLQVVFRAEGAPELGDVVSNVWVQAEEEVTIW